MGEQGGGSVRFSQGGSENEIAEICELGFHQ